jgi:hypothetical protein
MPLFFLFYSFLRLAIVFNLSMPIHANTKRDPTEIERETAASPSRQTGLFAVDETLEQNYYRHVSRSAGRLVNFFLSDR